VTPPARRHAAGTPQHPTGRRAHRASRALAVRQPLAQVEPEGLGKGGKAVVIDGLAGLGKRQTKDKLGLRRLLTEVSRAEELIKAVINWCLSYQTK